MDEKGRKIMPTLTVNVVDYNTNRAVPDAIVTINSTAVVTNNRGQAVFQASTNSYSLNVTKFHYTPEGRILTLSSNQTLTIKLIPRLETL